MKNLFALLTICASLLAFTGCSESEGPAESAGKQIDEAMESGKESVDEAMEESAEKIEEAGDALREKVEENTSSH